ncbi:MAG: TraR/DksA C4-type zinc finger protein [bacterium]|nr:TraR/DksA C4-type zinc finger protein [bacterium]
MAINTDYFKKKLEAEKKLLIKELEKIGRRNPDNLSDWEAIPNEKDTSQADENTVADNIEGYEENVAILKTLEARYQDLKIALDKIKQGAYGLCEVCKKEIDEERLLANPSARTCREHME